MRLFRQLAARVFLVGVFMTAAVCAGGAAAGAVAMSGPGQVGLVGVRFGGDAAATRVVLDLDAAVSGKLAADENTSGHLVIALPPLLSTGPLQGPGKGLVTAWSIRADAAGARLILDIPPGAAVVRRFLIPPSDEIGRWRYVIDLRGSPGDPLSALLDGGAPRLAAATVGSPPTTSPPTGSPAAPAPRLADESAPWSSTPGVSAPTMSTPAPRPIRIATAANPPPPVSAPDPPPAPKYVETAPWSPTPAESATAISPPAPRPPAPPRTAVSAVRAAPVRTGPERGMKVIVIDPGHGGHDTGAQSLVRNEKDITLAAALSLRAHLLKMGHYKVVMTRDSDVFVPLPQRVQIARRAGADLFISLHADSAGSDPTPHGASVYTLSDSGEQRVNYVLGPHEWFARAGNGQTTPDVRQILLDITQRNTRNRSSEFAAKLLSHIGDKVELLPRSHRDAGYFVLLAPDVPAVLLEMGFITNPADQMRLTDPAQRDQLTSGIAEAIDDYFYGGTRFAAGF